MASNLPVKHLPTAIATAAQPVPQARGTCTRGSRFTLRPVLLLLAGSLLLAGCALTPLGVNPGVGPCSGSTDCIHYLTQLRDHVDSYWIPDPRGPLGKVKVAFRLDETGNVAQVEVADADSSELADGVLFAFRAAMPLHQPPPPELVARRLLLTFRHEPPPFNRARLSIAPTT